MSVGQLAWCFMRFTIRELILATTIVAVSLGWWVDRSVLYEVASTPCNLWRRRAEVMAEVLHDEGWTVTWNLNDMDFKKGPVNGAASRSPEFSVIFFGDGALPDACGCRHLTQRPETLAGHGRWRVASRDIMLRVIARSEPIDTYPLIKFGHWPTILEMEQAGLVVISGGETIIRLTEKGRSELSKISAATGNH